MLLLPPVGGQSPEGPWWWWRSTLHRVSDINFILLFVLINVLELLLDVVNNGTNRTIVAGVVIAVVLGGPSAFMESGGGRVMCVCVTTARKIS